MRLIAFIEGRPKPQPRTTQKSRFLFGKSVEEWVVIDEENAAKAKLSMLNKKGKPFKATRYAYRLSRLLAINEYRRYVYETVCRACNDGVVIPNCEKIPKQNLFIFYLFKIPTRWKKARRQSAPWTIHEFKPDAKNCWTAIEDALYDNDSECSHISHYKLYVPEGYNEGVLILHDEEIHSFMVETAKGFLGDIFT